MALYMYAENIRKWNAAVCTNGVCLCMFLLNMNNDGENASMDHNIFQVSRHLHYNIRNLSKLLTTRLFSASVSVSMVSTMCIWIWLCVAAHGFTKIMFKMCISCFINWFQIRTLISFISSIQNEIPNGQLHDELKWLRAKIMEMHWHFRFLMNTNCRIKFTEYFSVRTI